MIRSNWTRLVLTLALACVAHDALAFGVQGHVGDTVGGNVYPCDIDIIDRNTGSSVIVPGDTTLPNGNYVLTLPNGRYDITFNPTVASHLFQGVLRDIRVNNNTVVQNLVLPEGRYLQGRVVNGSGVGVGGVNIRFKDADGNAPNNVQDSGTLADGTFLTLVDPGLWNVEVIPAVASHYVPKVLPAVDLTVDQAVGDVVVTPGWIVTCTVTDLGLFPIAGAKVTVRTSPSGAKQFTPQNVTSPAGVVAMVVAPGTYDLTAEPPPGPALANVTRNAIVVAADLTVPNFALPPGLSLAGRSVTPSLAGVANVDLDVDVMTPPVFPRVEVSNDFTNATGNFSVLVAAGTYRLTLSPPIATRLLPVRLLNVAVAGATNLGNIVHPQGHWVDVTVREQGFPVPLPGSNLDFIDPATGELLVTPGDVANGSGFARVVTDQKLYRLRVVPPSSQFDTLVVENFRSLNDTVLTLELHRRSVSAPAPRAVGLRLASPWPNPARDGVTFAFAAPEGGELSVWDASGRRVASLWSGASAAETSVRWSAVDAAGSPLPAGVYFATLVSKGHREVRRVAVVR